ncbi:hypothetical protein D3C72_1785220 [compost metagenome]
MAAGKDAVTRAAEHPFGITSDDVRRLGEILGLVDDAVAQQKAVDRFQRNAGDNLGHRAAANLRRQLYGGNIFPKLHLPVRPTCRSQEQQGE